MGSDLIFTSTHSRARAATAVSKSYFALFPSLHFLRQVQFIVIATTSTAARARLRRSFLGQSQFVGRLTFWGTVILELKKNMKNVKYSIVSLPPPSFHFFAIFCFLDEFFSSEYPTTFISRGKNVINTTQVWQMLMLIFTFITWWVKTFWTRLLLSLFNLMILTGHYIKKSQEKWCKCHP